MAAPKLTLTSEQTAALLRANPFGPMTWARQVMSAEDALSFAVHTGLVNIDIRPLCPCGQRKYLTATENRAGSFCHAICKRHGTNATPDGIRYSICWWILHIPWILLPPSGFFATPGFSSPLRDFFPPSGFSSSNGKASHSRFSEYYTKTLGIKSPNWTPGPLVEQ